MKEDVKVALQKKADAVLRSTDLLLEKTRDWQLIKSYLSNRVSEIELTETQQAKLARYQFIYNQLSSGKHTDNEVVAQLMKKDLYGVSQSQAYEDMSCARELFSSVVNINKRFEINLQLQINRKLLIKAEEMCDFKAAAAFEKNRALLLKLIPEEDETPADAFEGHLFEAVFDPRLLGAPDVDMKEVLKVINEKRGKKIDVDMFDSIPYEDLTDDSNKDSLQQTPTPE